MQLMVTPYLMRAAAVVAWLALLGALPAAAQSGVTIARPPVVSGYLSPEQRPDHTVFLPPPPAPESVLGVADMAVYRATRALEGSARWLGLIGLVPLATAIFAWCPAYAPFGIKTCKA